MRYPTVLSEEETLRRVLAGASIGRYGDGELSIMDGGNCVSQRHDPVLAQELREIIGVDVHNRAKNFIVGIPTLDPRSPKIKNWTKLKPRFENYTTATAPKTFTYGSAFLTRPDSAPWINTVKFFDDVQSLWQDQEVILVANGVRSLTKEFLEANGAGSVCWVQCPYRDAYASAAGLYKQVEGLARREGIRRVILCCGPTATVLADKLAGGGLHAIDLGHIGMFWRRYLDPKNPIELYVEKREINKATGKVEPNP